MTCSHTTQCAKLDRRVKRLAADRGLDPRAAIALRMRAARLYTLWVMP